MSKLVAILLSFIFVAVPEYAANARSSSITAELARMCRQGAIAAHPTPRPGTKAKGIKEAQREYFQACVKNGPQK
jgi:hypothetical protein